MDILNRVRLTLDYIKRNIPFFSSGLGDTLLIGGSVGLKRAPSLAEALSISDVYRCVNLIADRMVELPLSIVRKDADGSEVELADHPVQRLLKEGIGEWYDPPDFIRTVVVNLLLYGNFYAYIITSGARIESLQILNPVATTPRFLNQRIIYDTTIDQESGSQKTLDFQEVLHIKNFSITGLIGLSPIATARTSMNLALSATQYGQRFFDNDATPSLALLLDDNAHLTRGQLAGMETEWEREHGTTNQRKPVVVAGVKEVQQLSVAPNESQFLETRMFSRRDVSNMFGVPAVLLSDPSASTYNNIRELNRAFATDTLIPLARRIAEAINKQLLVLSSDEGAYARFDFDSYLDDTAEKYAALSQAVGGRAILTINEARERLGMPAIEGGDELPGPVNGQVTFQMGERDEENGESENETERGERQIRQIAYTNGTRPDKAMDATL